LLDFCMTNHAIHWAEGMLLRPHHFQAAERSLRDELQLSENWNVGYAYGLRKLDVDHDALVNWRIVVRACQARFRDGLHLSYPESASLAPAAVPRDAFKTAQDRVMVYLGVPRFQPGHKNADGSADSACRFVVDTEEIEDENKPGNAQQLEIRWLNARLLVGEAELSGYETLPLMRLRLGTTAEAPPEIDPEYIPPILACDAWPILNHHILETIYDRVGSTADLLSRQMIDRGVAFESGHREDLERILKLHSLNHALGYLINLPFVRGVHPLPAYMELCRVVGLLAIFQPDRRMPEVPRYDHDDLGKCFYAIRRLLDLGPDVRQRYIKRPFVGAGLQMQVRLEREWLEPTWSFYIGVESNLAFGEVDKLLMRRLDMKVGSSEEVDRIYNRGQAGVNLTPEPQVPRDLPATNWTYWKVDRGSEAWKQVEKTLNLGIRFNERQVEGEIDGQQYVRIKMEGGNLVGLSFALYAMPAPVR
jgi:type VI secretion system protein ImpJ